MVILYYSPGACSLAVHIALLENDIEFKLIKVNLKTHQTQDDVDFYTINPKGFVPVITTDHGDTLTEAAAILFYVQEQGKVDSPFTTTGLFDRYRVQEMLTFISSELHKRLSVYFDPRTPAGFKDITHEKLTKSFNFLEGTLKDHEFLIGNNFTVADAYCFTILNWLNKLDTGLILDDWPHLKEYMEKIAKRPKVLQALEEEGLTKS